MERDALDDPLVESRRRYQVDDVGSCTIASDLVQCLRPGSVVSALSPVHMTKIRIGSGV